MKMGNSQCSVSNGSSRNVYVKVQCDTEYETSAKVGVAAKAGAIGGLGVNVNQKKHWNKPNKVGYTKVNRYSSIEFHPDASKGHYYVTIKPKLNSERSICENHPLKLGRGLIIDKSGYVHTAHKKDKWVDTDGINHKPDFANKDFLPKDDMCSALT